MKLMNPLSLILVTTFWSKVNNRYQIDYYYGTLSTHLFLL